MKIISMFIIVGLLIGCTGSVAWRGKKIGQICGRLCLEHKEEFTLI